MYPAVYQLNGLPLADEYLKLVVVRFENKQAKSIPSVSLELPEQPSPVIRT